MNDIDRLWSEWRATPRPFANFRREDAHAPSYQVEHDLDHQADYIGALMRARNEGNPNWNVSFRAGVELEELKVTETRLSDLERAGGQFPELRTYIRITRALLETLSGVRKEERTRDRL